MDKIEFVFPVKNLKIVSSYRNFKELVTANIDFDFAIVYGDTRVHETQARNLYYFSVIEFWPKSLVVSPCPEFGSKYFKCSTYLIKEAYHPQGFIEGFRIEITDINGEKRHVPFYKGCRHGSGEPWGLTELLEYMQNLDNFDIQTWREFDLFQKVRYEQWKLIQIKHELSESRTILNKPEITKTDIDNLKDNLEYSESTLTDEAYGEHYKDYYEWSHLWEGYNYRVEKNYRIKELSRGQYYM